MIEQPPTPHSSASLPPSSGIPPHTWIVFLSFCLILGIFYGLYQLDGPTLTIVHGFTDPWIDQIGDLGNALGKGVTLVLISLGIGGVGLWLNSPKWKFAGLYSLLAHGLSGLLTQTLKHSLGRPRPRLMDHTPWEVGPSFESGLDSFPSGHTSASFSFATVLAYYFPGSRILWFGLAGFVTISRIIKGSHFPTDALGGILLGIGSGLILVHARNQWQEATSQFFVHGLPWLVTAFGLLWILVPHPGIELAPDISLFLACMLVMTGLGLRLLWIRECSKPNTSAARKVPTWPRVLMGLGLASSTGSVVIVGASVMAGIIWWLGTQSELTIEVKNNFLAGLNPIWIEAIVGLAMFFLVLLTFTIRSG